MARSSLRRLVTALVAVLSLLFAQLALAAYVCPRDAEPAATQALMEAGVPCDGIDPAQPALCHQHMADPAKTPGVLELPTAGPPAVVQVLERPPVSVAEAAFALPAVAAPDARPPPDPLFLATLRLRV